MFKSRQLDEYERHWQFVLAGGKPEEWTWQYRSVDGSPVGTKENIAGSIITQWNAMGGRAGAALKGNIEEAADRGIVQRVTQLEDGKFMDEEGNVMDMPPGHFFVPKRVSD